MLYNQADKREYERREFLATLICGPLKKDAGEGGGGSGGAGKSGRKERFADLEYNGDPKSVEHLSAEEREAMTKRLMEKFSGMGQGLGKG